jgi:radical SAM-linked protein
MSEGFHVRPRVSFALARGVAVASQSEWLDFELSDWVNPDTVYRKLAPQLPAGIAICELQPIAPGERAVAREAIYVVRPEQLPEDIDQRIAGLLGRESAVVERGHDDQKRSVDIRPLLLSLERQGQELTIVAHCGNEGTLKPDEVLRLLGFAPESVARSLVTRTRLVLA